MLPCKTFAGKCTTTDFSFSWLGHSFSMAMLARTSWMFLPHAPYSSDDIPDFYLFPKLKEPMLGRFSSLEELSTDDTRAIGHMNKSGVLDGIIMHSIPSRAFFSRHFLLSQRPSQFLFLFYSRSSIILPSPTLSSKTAFFILSIHFTRSIIVHIHIC